MLTGLQVYGFTPESLIYQIYVVLKDSLEYEFTGLQVFISASKLDKTLDEMFNLYRFTSLRVYIKITYLANLCCAERLN